MLKVLRAFVLSVAVVSGFAFILSLLGGDYRPAFPTNTITIDKSNLIVLFGEVSVQSVHEVMQKAHELDSDPQAVLEKRPIYLFLRTPGGDVEAGLDLIVYLHGLRRPVHTITAFAASMGFHLAQNLGTRYMTESGTLMSHHARGGVSGELGGLPGSQLEKRLQYWKDRLEIMDLVVVSRTLGKQSLRSYREAYENELWLTPYRAIREGYADEIIDVRCGDTGEASLGNIGFLGLQIKIKVPSCPLDSNVEADTSGLTPEQKALLPKDINEWYKNHIVPLDVK